MTVHLRQDELYVDIETGCRFSVGFIHDYGVYMIEAQVVASQMIDDPIARCDEDMRLPADLSSLLPGCFVRVEVQHTLFEPIQMRYPAQQLFGLTNSFHGGSDDECLRALSLSSHMWQHGQQQMSPIGINRAGLYKKVALAECKRVYVSFERIEVWKQLLSRNMLKSLFFLVRPAHHAIPIRVPCFRRMPVWCRCRTIASTLRFVKELTLSQGVGSQGRVISFMLAMKSLPVAFVAVITVFVVFLFPPAVSAEDDVEHEFRYRYIDGEHYRILSTVNSDVFVNGRFNQSQTILNRISVDVAEIDDYSGRLTVHYQVSSENSTRQGAFRLASEFHTVYIRDHLGYDDVPEGRSRPLVRDVPVFPERKIRPGDTWSAVGTEVVDLRESFGIDAIEHFPIPVAYEYVGVDELDGIEVDIFDLEYNMFYRPASVPRALYPERITGYSRQRHYWDRELARPHAYEEEFEINYDLSNGQTWTWRGRADARITDTSFDDRDAVIGELRERFRDDEDVDIRDDDRGITISLEAIGFEPDSTQLRAGEEQRLEEIADLLREYRSGELLITGHTAMAGTEEGRQVLSEDRARLIAEYLIEQGVRERDEVLYRGMGARDPIASNEDEAGRRRNRRVEFTILEE